MKSKILLVEDDHALQLTITEYLEPAYHVTAVKTAKQALESLKDTHYKLLLVDLGLPDANGLSVIRKAAEDHPNTIILALTGDKSLETVQEAIKAGVDDYLAKPVSSTRLRNRIEAAILRRTLGNAKK